MSKRMSELLKKLREEKGYTQEFMAERLGYSGKSGYCLLENGSVRLTIDRAAKIAEILDVDPSVFFALGVEASSTTEQAATTESQTGTEG